jgi:Xaa-Pro aminopeptidase
VNGLAGNLYFSEPLNAQQEDNLVQILAGLSPGYQGGGIASTKQIQDWNAAFMQAQSVLSPNQLEAMKSAQATYQAGLQAVREALAPQTK